MPKSQYKERERERERDEQIKIASVQTFLLLLNFPYLTSGTGPLHKLGLVYRLKLAESTRWKQARHSLYDLMQV